MMKQLVLAGALAASAFGAQVTLDISGGVNGVLQSETSGVFPEGTVTSSGITFNIGPSTGPNYWNAFNEPSGNPRSFAVPVNLTGVTHIYTLINSFWGNSSTSLASISLVASDASLITLNLMGDDDIREWTSGSTTNSINGTTPALGSGDRGTINWFTDSGTGDRLDALVFALPSSWYTKTVDLVFFEDNGADGDQRIFVSGVTAEFDPAPTPEPATFGLVAVAGLALAGLRRRN